MALREDMAAALDGIDQRFDGIERCLDAIAPMNDTPAPVLAQSESLNDADFKDFPTAATIKDGP